jgi:hypothetical protein
LFKSITSLEQNFGSLFGGGENNSGTDGGDNAINPRGDFERYWGWQHIIIEMSEGNPIIEDAIYEWEVIRFLNRLSYLKEKAQVEEQINRMKLLNNGR